MSATIHEDVISRKSLLEHLSDLNNFEHDKHAIEMLAKCMRIVESEKPLHCGNCTCNLLDTDDGR